LLPVFAIVPELVTQLGVSDCILVAPPGAGKSTCVPLELLKGGLFGRQKIIMLQPRRIAVRNIARYLAAQLNEPVGQTIGYRIRGETKVSSHTQLEIVTEGILTRMLQNDPELPGVGLIIFDEFHERSIHGDFSLALCIEVQETLRADLRLLVMSATLDVAALTPIMPQAMHLACEGRSYPVEVFYQPDTSAKPLYQKICHLTQRAFNQHDGDILVFLPGAWEIRQAAVSLQHLLPGDVTIHALFSELSQSEQQAAITPDPQGKRKIILATNIAETSLTIEGVTVVVDSGMQKTAVYQLNKGVTELQLGMISKASATQRAGRAGRLKAGSCYRLWSLEQHQRLAAHQVPEILTGDMAPFILEASLWGTAVKQLALIDMPSAAQLDQGEALLVALQAKDSHGQLTEHGRAMHRLGCHPTVANMLIKSARLSDAHQSLACAIAALLEEKDPLGHQAGTELYARLRFLQQHPQHRIWQVIGRWQRKVKGKAQPWPLSDAGVLLGFAFPHWLAKSRNADTFQLANGTGAKLPPDDPLAGQDWLVMGHMLLKGQDKANAQITLGERISLGQIETHFAHLIILQQRCLWDEQRGAIVAQSLRKLGDIVIDIQALAKPKTVQLTDIWLQVIRTRGVMNLPFDERSLQLIYRLRLARKLLGHTDWPDVSEQGLDTRLEQWLVPYLSDKHSWQQLKKLNFYDLIANNMDWSQQQKLNTLLPTKMRVPSGSVVPLIYSDQGDVTLSVRMQEVYSMVTTPTLAQGKLNVQMELLSPAGRPLQKTQDLAGFWQGSYKDVQKEMKGRYQKHFWPDDPATAIATSKTKKKMGGSG
jgi:ATP-dependent helicase HrpB